jgi:hypothetical protein
MCKIDNIKFFEQLHKDYYASADDKERVTLRNGILREIIPLMENITAKFSCQWNNGDYDDDLFQELAERAMLTIIPSWKPTGSSIEGYYKTCFYNVAQNYINARTRQQEYQTSIDPQDTFFWGIIAGTEDPATQPIDSWDLPEGLDELAYDFVKEALLHGSFKGGRRYLIKLLREEYELPRVKAYEVYNHALISCREMYLGKSYDCDLPEIEKGSLFERLSEHLTKSQTEDILRVFGGIWIRIPNGMEKNSYD